MAEILLLEPNLFFSSRVGAAAERLGHRVTTVGSAEEVWRALAGDRHAALIVHFGLPTEVWRGALDARDELRPDLLLLAYGPHEQVAAFRELRARGAVKVLARGKFVRDLPQLLKEHLPPG